MLTKEFWDETLATSLAEACPKPACGELVEPTSGIKTFIPSDTFWARFIDFDTKAGSAESLTPPAAFKASSTLALEDKV